MRLQHAAPQRYIAADHRVIAQGKAVEWEELPSLVRHLARDSQGASTPRTGPVWDNTRPADLEASVPAAPFNEVLHGLSVREVMEPDVFRHFFGDLGLDEPGLKR